MTNTGFPWNRPVAKAVSATQAYVLGVDGNLWLETAPWGKVPPAREQVDGNVAGFWPLSASEAYVLGTDGNLWLENAPWGTVPPGRKHVDGPPPSVPVPGGGLGSNSNYILCANGDPLIDLSVTVDVTEDVVFQTATGEGGAIIAGKPGYAEGFAFQLNAYSAQGFTDAWQQYCFILWDTELTGMIDNWPQSGANIINDIFSLAPLPNTTLRAGYKFSIVLTNDNKGNVTAVTFHVIDHQGRTTANVTRTLTDIQGVTAAGLAPIVAFELNLVGPINGESSTLTSGAGTITYSAKSALTALPQEPSYTESGYITAETANSVYSVLPPAASNTLTQYFHIVTERPMISKLGKPRPSTRVLQRPSSAAGVGH
jgi:hypothetical protein